MMGDRGLTFDMSGWPGLPRRVLSTEGFRGLLVQGHAPFLPRGCCCQA